MKPQIDGSEQLGEQEEPVLKTDRPTLGKRTADRPHQLTLLASFGALLISLGGLAISWQSYQTSSRTAAASLHLNESNQKLTEMVQSAWIETASELITPLTLLDKEPDDNPRKVVFSWTISNAGNTAANSVRTLRVVHLTDGTSGQEIGQPNRSTVHMGPRQRQSVPFDVILSSDDYRLFRQDKKWLEIDGQIIYGDIFGKDHEFDWHLRLKGDGTMEYRQFSPPEKAPQ